MPGRPDRALASMGIYVFNASFLYEQLIRDADDSSSSHDFGKDIIPRLVKEGAPIRARLRTQLREHDQRRAVLARRRHHRRLLGSQHRSHRDVVPELNLYDRDWPIWTYQEQLPPAKFVFDDDDRRGMAIDSIVSGGCIVSGSTRAALAALHQRARAQPLHGRGLRDPAQRGDRPGRRGTR